MFVFLNLTSHTNTPIKNVINPNDLAPATTKNIRNVYNRVNDMISRIILNGEDVDTVLAEYQNEFQAEFDEMKANGTFIY